MHRKFGNDCERCGWRNHVGPVNAVQALYLHKRDYCPLKDDK